jgi:predicted ATP-grasp superfamily ATP-dependent carboligase
LALLFINFFPIVALSPNWHKILNTNGVLYPLAISAHKNKKLSKQMQSKLFWYHCFSENGIQTPKIYYLKNKELIQINPIQEDEKNYFFIVKPEYGTQGQSIKKIKLNELSTIKDGFLVQEFVSDCFVKKARHFRINTISIKENIIIFSIDERKQSNNKIASNHANGGNITFCKNNICDFLSTTEQNYIQEISNQLSVLHKKHSMKFHLLDGISV